MTQLYKLVGDYAAIQQLIDDGEVEPATMETALGQLKGAIEVKAENIGKMVLNWKAEAKAIEVEIERLGLRRVALIGHVNSAKDYLQRELEFARIDHIKLPTLTISIRTNQPSVNVIDEGAVPAQFTRIIPPHYEVNKVEILRAWKQDKLDIPGVCITANKKRLEIR